MQNPTRAGFVNLILENCSDLTIICECRECREKQLRDRIKKQNRQRMRQMRLYLLDSTVTKQDDLLKEVNEMILEMRK